MTPYVREVTPGDIRYVAEHMRQADVSEIYAVSGRTPLESLQWSVEGALIACTVQGKYPCAIFGLSIIDDMLASVWFMGTDELMQKHVRYEFIKQSRIWFDRLNDVRPILFNYVDERNTTHIRWVKFCGGVFIQRHEEHGFEKRPFLEFCRINKEWRG